MYMYMSYVIKSVDYRPTVLQAVLPETNECSTVMATSKDTCTCTRSFVDAIWGKKGLNLG